MPNYGIDADRVLALDPPAEAWQRRIDGRYPVDPFGGDPHLQDLVPPYALAGLRVDVEHGGAHPAPRSRAARVEPELRVGVEPRGARRAVRRVAAGACACSASPRCPLVGAGSTSWAAIGRRPHDVAALLRAGHLAAVPLAPDVAPAGRRRPAARVCSRRARLPGHAGRGAPRRPVRRCRSAAGTSSSASRSHPPAGTKPGDQLAAAELAEQVRAAIRALLEAGLSESGRERIRSCGGRWRTDGVAIAYDAYGRIDGDAGPDDPGPRDRLPGLGAPAHGVRPPPPLLRDRQPRRRRQSDGPPARTRSSRWPTTRSRSSTPRASSGPT